jgi:hypothetical protein
MKLFRLALLAVSLLATVSAASAAEKFWLGAVATAQRPQRADRGYGDLSEREGQVNHPEVLQAAPLGILRALDADVRDEPHRSTGLVRDQHVALQARE